MFQEEYVAGAVSSFLGSKKPKETGDGGSTSHLFRPEAASTSSTDLNALKEKLHKLNDLTEKVQQGLKKERKRKIIDKVYEREASLREAGPSHPALKKKKVEKEENLEKHKGKEVGSRTLQRQHHKLKKQKLNKEPCTVFVGNLPLSTSKKTLKNIFKSCGLIESIRFRSAAPADLKMPKRAVVIKKEFHEKCGAINAYVVFTNKDAVSHALKKNGTVVEDHHIRVDKVSQEKVHDYKKSIFVGNLPYDMQEEAMREHFEECGEIDGVRIIRDAKTGVGKGFGYVLFKDTGAVHFALKMNEKECCGRKLRVKQATQNPSKPNDTTTQQGHKKKIQMPTNTPARSFQGIKAQRLQKIKRKMKYKKAQKSQRNESNKKGKGNGQQFSSDKKNFADSKKIFQNKAAHSKKKFNPGNKH